MSEQIDVIPLETYLDDQAEKLTDLCTRCGKCVEVCPAIREGSPMLAEAEPASVIGRCRRPPERGAWVGPRVDLGRDLHR